MGVYTFICRITGKEWSAKPLHLSFRENWSNLLTPVPSSSSFSHVTPSSAVFQVIVGGPSFGGGAAAASAPDAAAASAVTPPAAEEEEESDDDMGFSLFD